LGSAAQLAQIACGKLHLDVEAHSGEVVTQTLTAAGTDEARQIRPMREQMGGEIGRFDRHGADDR